MSVMYLLEVYFEYDKEVISLYEYLFRDNKKIELNWKTHKDWGNQLQFTEHVLNQHTNYSIAKAMVDVFISHRLSKLLKVIIREDYYYTNNDEIERILELTHWFYRERSEERRVGKECKCR